MDKETQKTIEKVAATVPKTTMRDWEVEVLLGKKIGGTVIVRARDKEHAKERAFVSLNFNVKKYYGGNKP